MFATSRAARAFLRRRLPGVAENDFAVAREELGPVSGSEAEGAAAVAKQREHCSCTLQVSNAWYTKSWIFHQPLLGIK